MFDCAEDVTAYHDERVTLSQAERNEMRERRNSNRDRLRAGLTRDEKPQPAEIASQGSYSMKTMVQHPERDYDIDDGAYFNAADLVGPKGGAMSPLDTRQMVCDALADERFKQAPEVRENCVRIYYDEGYHIDVPSYRRTVTKGPNGETLLLFELAGADWKAADARAVTEWFERCNKNLSPDEDNGRQFRRVVRLAKKFCRSRASWSGRVASGFMVTKLCSERFRPASARDDVALRETLEGVRDRLKADLVVKHPVVPNETISKGVADPKAIFLRDRLDENLEHLKALDDPECDREKALDAWAAFFGDSWYSDRPKDSKKAAAFVFGTKREGREPAVDKRGGGTYA